MKIAKTIRRAAITGEHHLQQAFEFTSDVEGSALAPGSGTAGNFCVTSSVRHRQQPMAFLSLNRFNAKV
jgi:hypothetical protein